MSEEGWFFAEDSRTRDADGKATGQPNVMGRFDDLKVIDGPASKEARRNIYKLGIGLRARVLVSPMGSASNDVSSHTMKFSASDPDRRFDAETALKRFPSAWKDYQKRRKAPLQDGERELLEEIGMWETVKKRGPKAKAEGKVVHLKTDAA